MNLSIIIPTFNEAENIPGLVAYLFQHGGPDLREILVIDAGSTDGTIDLAKSGGAIAVLSPDKGRAAQMNYGAALAGGDVFYFVHADTRPPKSYLDDIRKAIAENYSIGRYLSAYASKSRLLKLNAYLSRLDVFGGMGGDQTLFITAALFRETGGFNGSMKIMEEFEFCVRARKKGRYKIIRKPVMISARKYDDNSWLKVQRANYTVVKMYKEGASQEELVKTYRSMINHR